MKLLLQISLSLAKWVTQRILFYPDYKRFTPDLYDLVVVKNSIGQIVWYLLTGILVILNSHNYIMTMKCDEKLMKFQPNLIKL